MLTGKLVLVRPIKLHRNPYDDKVNLFNKATFEFRQGLNVLVGCNGSGKSTVIKLLKDYLMRNDVLYLDFDNLTDGGGTAMNRALYYSKLDLLSMLYMSSEGENIHTNIGNFIAMIRRKVKESDNNNEFWLLLDAIDSGLSIDNILDIKDGLQYVCDKLHEEFGTTTYIVVSANSYELASGCHCIDVRTSKTVKFNSYEEYKKFILNSNEYKLKRYSKINNSNRSTQARK